MWLFFYTEEINHAAAEKNVQPFHKYIDWRILLLVKIGIAALIKRQSG